MSTTSGTTKSRGQTAIAFCLEYPIGLGGGVSILVQSLIRGLAEDHNIILVSPDTEQSFSASPLQPLIRQHLAYDPQAASAQTSRALARQISDAGADLAHFHLGGNFGWNIRTPARCPIVHTARLGVPVVTTNHMVVGLLDGFCGPQRSLAFKLALLPLAWLAKLSVLRYVRIEISVSQQDCRRLRRWYWPFRSRFAQLYHSRIQESAAPAANRPRDPIILCVGHVARRKGQLVLAEAFARIARRYPQWRLFLAGHMAEESCRPLLEQAAAKCLRTDQICLLGQRPDTFDLMKQAAVFVQPSFFEGLPLALQEALYCQCACLATRIPGNLELVEDNLNGLLIPAGNREAMASGLDRLLGDPALRDRLATQGRAGILQKKMTAAHMVERHRLFYAAVLRQS